LYPGIDDDSCSVEQIYAPKGEHIVSP